MNFALYREAAEKKALHMPYRRHQLTLLLKDCFVNPAHRTAVLACCSPTATDVEHTVRTLNQVCQMRGAEEEVSRSVRVTCSRTEEEASSSMAFRRWPPQRVRAWLMTLDEDLARAEVQLPATTDGRELLQRWPAARLAHSCLEGDLAAAKRLFTAIREESARVDAQLSEKRGRVRGISGRSDDKYGP
eukprot:3303285-Prymnesium_polylepis.1